MPFRAKLRKTFSRNSHRSSQSSADTSSSYGSSSSNNVDVYKPGEKIPQKYRRPVDKAHKAMLDSYRMDFGESSGSSSSRRSFQSECSPMGSRMPSRRNSIDMSATRRAPVGRRGATFLELAVESGSDSDLTRAGLPNQSSTFLQGGSQDSTASRHDSPFTQEDLSQAMRKTYLAHAS
ncbi:hypothetical protein EG328_000623 [Venturia inaequalis]|uniref:Uncharacterized protein n=1 Tax=Venturia inaequalis TaxID=5025 RepID=A0A8H3V0P9_VENIN|nr:hypothetical protein EG328_000623 [Venturia inaequalis]